MDDPWTRRDDAWLHDLEYAVPTDAVLQYALARRAFDEGDGCHVEPCVAAVVHATLVLTDPMGALALGDNAQVSSAYSVLAARLWWRMCHGLHALAGGVDEADDIDGPDDVVVELSFDDVFEIVESAMRATYPSSFHDDTRFAEIIATEFGDEAADPLRGGPDTEAVAGLVHAGLGALPPRFRSRC